MNVFILTQEDAFYIPKLLEVFYQNKPKACTVAGAAILKGEIAAKNSGNYFKFLGPTAFLKIGTLYALWKGLDVASRVLPLKQAYSVAGFLRKVKTPTHYPTKINTPEFHQFLRDQKVELLISVACPQIVRQELLDLPPQKCINIHGALLPKYRGKMPSFWVLAHGETETGVTVHYMNPKLDDGPIIVQKRVPIAPEDTLHSLVLKSKVNFGGFALAEAVKKIMDGPVETMVNDASQASYFSFPTPEAVSAFRKHGRRFR